jgi:AAA+ ATPase superfamily predicted ATPase
MNKPKKFFQTGGTLSEDAPSYIERYADKQLIMKLSERELCLVLGPRQVGKSSLVVHAFSRLKKKGIYTGIVDCQQLGNQKDVNDWFTDVIYQIERSLKIKMDCVNWWKTNSKIGTTQRFMTFLEDVLLKAIKKDVIIFFDEIDSVLSLPFSDDFFTTIRSIYNARSHNPTLKRLTFTLIGVTTPSSFIKDRSRTPFNIGTSIVLDYFDKDSVAPFKKILGPESDKLIDRIFYWTNGQPYLVQKLSEVA